MSRIVPWLYWFGHFLSTSLFRLLGKWRVYGRENVPRTGGAVIAANHTSYLDPPVVGGGLKRPCFYMGKKQLFEVPVLGFLIRRTGCFPVDRDHPDTKVIRFAVELLKQGNLLCIFPEGGRSPDGELMVEEAGVGPALIANRAGAPIIPAYIRGTFKSYPMGGKFPRRADISITYGEPIDTAAAGGGKASKAELQEITARVMAAIAQLGQREPGGGSGESG
ncbi:MAG: 1-acyl-sn-glycerol-3-phosphate acyltransferase [Armatimonadetes bacterium]|nr:1-acyl-sn-glycerol-3-phosphate acyltransferase [Armatimonadota bacterium]